MTSSFSVIIEDKPYVFNGEDRPIALMKAVEAVRLHGKDGESYFVAPLNEPFTAFHMTKIGDLVIRSTTAIKPRIFRPQLPSTEHHCHQPHVEPEE
jgi:hypothetical protein